MSDLTWKVWFKSEFLYIILKFSDFWRISGRHGPGPEVLFEALSMLCTGSKLVWSGEHIGREHLINCKTFQQTRTIYVKMAVIDFIVPPHIQCQRFLYNCSESEWKQFRWSAHFASYWLEGPQIWAEPYLEAQKPLHTTGWRVTLDFL